MYMPEAEKRVKTELVIDAIRKAEGIEPAESDIEKATAEQAERSGQDPETFKKNLTEEQKDYLKDNAAIRMALDLMKKDATILEKKDEKAEDKPEKKPAARKSAKKEAAAEEAGAEGEEKKPARKTAAKKAVKKDEAAEEAPAEEEKKPAKKPAAKKKASTEE